MTGTTKLTNQAPQHSNRSKTVDFILRGADKRRRIAYGKAKQLQQELGVIPVLQSVK